jgi:serpin B
MAKTLHFGNAVHEGFAALGRQLVGKQPGSELAVANRLFVQRGFPLLEPFTAIARDQYAAPVEQVDFGKEETRLHVNQWVEAQTNRRITDLVGEGVFTADTRLALINAISFKGSWATEFDKKATTTQKFLAGGKNFDVQLMFRQMAGVRYCELNGVQVLELPYKGDLTMVVLLPRQRDVKALEKRLNAVMFEQLISGLKPAELVDVWLPRFQLTQSFGLKDTLGGMGMPKAFVGGTADFSGMTGTRDLFIGAVIHKASVEVNEEGTEAAAATAVVMGIGSLAPPPVVRFRVDRPFLFALRDTKSGSVLILGRLEDPFRAP